MIIKVNEEIYNSDEQPILVALTKEEKAELNNLPDELTKFCAFPKSLDDNYINNWMKDVDERGQRVKRVEVYNITMTNLEIAFNSAKAMGMKYIGVLIETPFLNSPELIISDIANFDNKLHYYKTCFNYDLTNKSSSNIKIVGFTFGNHLYEIEEDLFND